MKKLVFLLVAAWLCAFSVHAQRQHQPRMQNPEKMAQMRTERLAGKYNLSKEQTEKLLDLNTDMMSKMKEMRPERLPKDSLRAMDKAAKAKYRKEQKAKQEARKEAHDEMRANYEKELKNIFTPEQYTAFKKDEQERMKRREMHRERNFERRQPSPFHGRDFENDDF